MSDELKPCPFCGGEVKLKTDDAGGYLIECGNHEWPKNRFMQGIPNQTIAADVLMCSWGQGEDAKQALIEAWNTRADDALISEKPAPSLKESTEDTQALSDSRERLEADMLDYVVRMAKLCHGMGLSHELWQFNPEPLRIHICQCLDRQAAITRAEVFEDGEFDCMTCAAKVELREQVDELTAERDELETKHERIVQEMVDANTRQCERTNELTAERDELRDIIDHMPKTEQECETCQEAHDRLMFNAKVDMDELRDELKHKQLVIDRQRDSFAKMECECAELRRMLADAAEAI